MALADQPRLIQGDYRELVERFDGAQFVAAHYAEKPGVPAIFPRGQFEALMRLNEDRGAKPILQTLSPQTIKVPLPAAALDVDTATDIDGAAP